VDHIATSLEGSALKGVDEEMAYVVAKRKSSVRARTLIYGTRIIVATPAL
jgi:hypothetical protein